LAKKNLLSVNIVVRKPITVFKESVLMRRKTSQSTHGNNRNVYINICIQIYCIRTKELWYPRSKKKQGRYKHVSEDNLIYRGAGKSLARPGRKQATATEDFDVHIYDLSS